MQNKHQKAEAEIAKLNSEIETLKSASNANDERNEEDRNTLTKNLAELQDLHDYQISINDELNKQIEENEEEKRQMQLSMMEMENKIKQAEKENRRIEEKIRKDLLTDQEDGNK